jgi:two-component system cell cycle sensor histidine kinase PleC
MLLNLLSNAVKFTPEQGTVKIRAFSQGGCIFITVQDTGCGIDPRDFERVLSPYRQAENLGIASEKGTGLGLPIAKSLIELHDGCLDLQSSLGQGTTVSLRFPSKRVIVDAGTSE